jgi:hypothetical protein
VEVLFNEAHAFQDREVRIYRLMAGLIEAALFQATPVQRTETQTAELPMLAYALAEDTLPTEELYNDNESLLEKGKQAVYRCWEAALAAVRGLPALRHPGLLAMKMVQRAREVTWQKPPLSVTLAGVATVLMLAFWIASGRGRGPASSSSLGSSAAPGSIATEQQESSEPAKVVPVEGASRTSKVHPGRISRNEPKLASGRVRRGRVGKNEVEYIGDDVTVRHFRYKPATQKGRTGASRVAYIGEDVTVRYFTPKQASSSANR